MEEEAIRQGLRDMRDDANYDRLYDAALCRAQADWLVGINASRLYSLLYDTTLNIGRVMTPTLALIISREEAISRFQPEPFSTVELRSGLTAATERLSTRSEADYIMRKCLNKAAAVEYIQKKRHTEKPPKLYDLTTLQRDANRTFGFSAQQTLDYTQSLYEKRLVTYPRTDSRYLTGDMERSLPNLAHAVAGAFLFTTGLNLAFHPGQVIDDDQVTDHHAIIPTMEMAEEKLSDLPAGELDILHLISVRLLAALGDDHEYEETTVTLKCEGILFTARGKTVTKMGWKIPEATFQGSLGSRADRDRDSQPALPELKEGQELYPVTTMVKEGKTTPPKRYTEDTLLAAMETAGVEDMPEDAERKGLGTPATRAGILEKLIACGYVERKGDKKTKSLVPTQKGIGVITILPDLLKSPALTAEWETRLKAIENGRAEAGAFLADITAMLKELSQTAERVPGTDRLFPTNHKVMGTCPHCGAPVMEKKAGYICQNPRCHFAIWKDCHFFTKQGKEMTPDMAASLLRDGRVSVQGFISRKTGKPYNADVLLKVDGDGNAKFSLEFQKKRKA
jgi:DNA topoisomerase-3